MNQPALIAEVLPVIEFSVAGKPLCQGSKIALVSGKRVKRGGDVWVKNPIASMVDQADRKTKTRAKGALTSWKARIAAKASERMTGPQWPMLWTGPIELQCEFVIPRSPSHYTSKGALTTSAPTVPTGDLDKLLRAVGDALTGVVYRDDVQIISFGASTKRFSETAAGRGGVFVKVRAL